MPRNGLRTITEYGARLGISSGSADGNLPRTSPLSLGHEDSENPVLVLRGDLVTVHRAGKHEGALEDARRTLGDATFEHLVAEAEARDPDHAAQHAIETLDRLIAKYSDD